MLISRIQTECRVISTSYCCVMSKLSSLGKGPNTCTFKITLLFWMTQVYPFSKETKIYNSIAESVTIDLLNLACLWRRWSMLCHIAVYITYLTHWSHFADSIMKCKQHILRIEYHTLFFKISIDNKLSLIKVMACCLFYAKRLLELLMNQFTCTCIPQKTHDCMTIVTLLVDKVEKTVVIVHDVSRASFSC